MTSGSLHVTFLGPRVDGLGHVIPPDTTDEQLVDMWLGRRRSAHTRRAYRYEADRFLAAIGCPLRGLTLPMLQRYHASLPGAVPTVLRAMAIVKSLLSFGHRVGYLLFNVGAVHPLERPPARLADRILEEAQVLRMIFATERHRDRALLLLLYGGGLRVAEAVELRWDQVTVRGDAGQVAVIGKRNRERSVLLPRVAFAAIQSLRETNSGDYVFPGRGRGHLHTTSAERIVLAAARRAGIDRPVSPHWLRHAHATHALERGAPIHLVQATLGHTSVATTGQYLHARPSDSSARFLAL